MTIVLPEEIRSNADGMLGLAKVFHVCSSCIDSEIRFDCSQLNFFDAGLCAILGVILAKMRTAGKRLSVDGRVVMIDMFKANNFYEFGIKGNKGEKPEIERIGFIDKLFFPYWNYENDEAKAFIKEYARPFLSLKYVPEMTVAVQDRMLDSMGELFNNAKIHAESSEGVFVCGKYSPKRGRLSFTIADAGIGFRERLVRDIRYDGTDLEAIEWAVSKKNTVRCSGIPGGLGLKLLKEFIYLNRGRLSITSGRGHWEMNDRQVAGYMFDNPIPGSAITIEVNALDENRYYLKSETADTHI